MVRPVRVRIGETAIHRVDCPVTTTIQRARDQRLPIGRCAAASWITMSGISTRARRLRRLLAPPKDGKETKESRSACRNVETAFSQFPDADDLLDRRRRSQFRSVVIITRGEANPTLERQAIRFVRNAAG